MGEVYLAEDSVLRRQVALKRLPGPETGGPAAKERFLREARAAARLNHPNICTVFDAGENEAGELYITMEYVPGGSLADAGDAPVAPDELLRVAVQVATGLAEAHAHGIIHRDLKPSNLMRTERGDVKIVDFGIAKQAPLTTAEAGSITASGSATTAGAIVGTVPYLSPEQAFGRDIDARSDIFSLGTVLYQLAAGRLPFRGDSAVEIIAAIAHAEPPPLDAARIGEGLDRVIRRCLRKRPEDRYGSTAELLADLQRLAAGGAAAESGAPRHNIPRALATFVGREAELRELERLILEHRLVTVTGAGGCGKTTLAFEAARRQVARFPDGVRQVSLAPIASPDMVASSLADTLGVKEAADRPLLETLAASLAGKRMLLVIDNCEHVIEEAAAVVAELLRQTAGVSIVTTSREALNVPGERVWAIPLLSRPAPGSVLKPEAAFAFDSIRLFVERAVANDPRFQLTESNVGSIVTICDRLDGIPLAIELAAARIRAMPVSEIRNRLDNCFHLLTAGTRGALARQQTLRGAVDWSFDLLEPAERLVFRRLAAFASGFDLAAAETVAGFGELTRGSVLDPLARLVDKSLVVSERTQGDAVRYRLLEPIRQYAAECLGESGEGGEIARRHFEHYAEVADRAYAERIVSSADWLKRLERDHDNFRAALAWAAREDRAAHLRLAGALAWFWHLHSHLTEGRRELHLALAGATGRTAHVARALWGESTLAAYQGAHAASREAGEKSLAIWREIDEPFEVAMTLESMGWSLCIAGEDQEALRVFEECLAIHRRGGDAKLVNRAVLGVCRVLVALHDFETAEPMAREALATAMAQQDLRDIHFASHFLADCALFRGDAIEAEKRYADSLRAAIAYGDRFEMIFEVQGIAMAVAGQGRDEEALRLAGAAEGEAEALGAVVTVPFWIRALEERLGPAVERLGPERAARLKQEGRALGFDAAYRQALDLDAP